MRCSASPPCAAPRRASASPPGRWAACPGSRRNRTRGRAPAGFAAAGVLTVPRMFSTTDGRKAMTLGNRQPMVFRLAKRAGRDAVPSDLAGPFLDESGACLGETPLFEAERDALGRRRWLVREQAALERVLSAGYGFPISLAG